MIQNTQSFAAVVMAEFDIFIKQQYKAVRHIFPVAFIMGIIFVFIIHYTQYEKKLLDAIFGEVFFYLLLLVRHIFNLAISAIDVTFGTKWQAVRRLCVSQQDRLTGLIRELLSLLAGVLFVVAFFSLAYPEFAVKVWFFTVILLLMLYLISFLSSHRVMERVVEALESGECRPVRKNWANQNPRYTIFIYNILLLLALIGFFIDKLNLA